MSTIPTHTRPQFTWLFLAVRRADLCDKPHRINVTAPDERAARRLLARDFVFSFAGRIPAGEMLI
ncbi:host cell division inhibitor Icd-like protein [Rahnella sp. ChDrAdgB13]|uniref:host cell division inhibitor Icd-like protein n=1 Tax=Rahnella sp. ChDrAdgB13 TaxID=1850581 RepID=UPI001AD88476|nr:host cell division inhibitor Icd-like protein [Rahnella sp. ChDrAdgB13]